MKISENYIVDIRVFLDHYYDLNYSWYEKLSHKICGMFLKEKNKHFKIMQFSKVKKEDILKGDVIFVKDEVGQILVYRNPLRVNLKLVKFDSESLRDVRLKILHEQGLTYDEEGNVVPIENNKIRKIFLRIIGGRK